LTTSPPFPLSSDRGEGELRDRNTLPLLLLAGEGGLGDEVVQHKRKRKC